MRRGKEKLREKSGEDERIKEYNGESGGAREESLGEGGGMRRGKEKVRQKRG